MHPTLPRLRNSDFPPIRRRAIDTVQLNLGYRCNQACLHCHVNAGPSRTEEMTRETIDAALRFIRRSEARSVDLTGGAPELHPDFRYLLEQASGAGLHIMDRCNLTVLEEPGMEWLAQTLVSHRVEIVASLPCYLEENVDNQRGSGVFEKSLRVLRQLNALGYGHPDSGLLLNLVYNPQGASLPPPQCALENDYRRILSEQYQIEFNRLFTIANMPIQRFGSTLISRGEFERYIALLKSAHSEQNLDSVMCRELISVDWQGWVYDCDFNQMLSLTPFDSARHISELDPNELIEAPIAVADHCYGCTAGQGSSCGGALG